MIDNPNRPTCGTCPHWYQWQTEPDTGTCHRSPPVILLNGDGECDTRWPEAAIYDGCGEHPDFPHYLANLKAYNLSHSS